LSNLFYANLGIKNYEYEMNNARFRFSDFINFLKLAKENEQHKEFSISWKPLKSKNVSEIIKSKFTKELLQIDAYEDMDELEIENLIKNDERIQTDLQERIQDEFNQIEIGSKYWIKLHTDDKSEDGIKLIQNFFRENYAIF